MIAVILTVASGCDNVGWGGVDVNLKPPRTKAKLAAETPGPAAFAAEESEALPELPNGPILLAGRRSGSEATLTVVGEIQGDAIGAFVSDSEVPGFRDRFTAELLAPGSEWVLFAQGVRVGRLTATSAGLNEEYCVPRPTISGVVELVPSAIGVELLMALPAQAAAPRRNPLDTCRYPGVPDGGRAPRGNRGNLFVSRPVRSLRRQRWRILAFRDGKCVGRGVPARLHVVPSGR